MESGASLPMTDDRTTPRAEARRRVLHPVDWSVQTGATDEVLRELGLRLARRRSHRRRLLGVAIPVAALALLFAVQTSRRTPAEPARAVAPSTGAPAAVVAVARLQVLPDGSTVEGRSDARYSLAFTPAERRVVLHSGEARFQVAKDASRPFLVEAGGVTARAIGTVFVVSLRAESVEVIVTEGKVQVDPVSMSDASPGSPVTLPLLSPGDFVEVCWETAGAGARALPAVTTLSAAELSSRLAWLAPRLDFSGTPLREAVAVINRHSPVRLTLADPRLGSLRLSGMLRADNVEALWQLLEEVEGVRVERTSDVDVVLHPRR
jgi:ferric-dicitrate binding protein FerR (iron transport regulator)